MKVSILIVLGLLSPSLDLNLPCRLFHRGLLSYLPQLSLPPSPPPLLPLAWAYEAPEDREDVFASRACPAFLLFDSAAYLADMTLELPCRCKPEQVQSVVWYYQRQLGARDTRVLTDVHGTALVDSQQVGRSGDQRSRFSIRLFSLLIFRAQPGDSGHYLCGSAHGDFFYGYDVDVQEARRMEPQGRGARRRHGDGLPQRGSTPDLGPNQDPLYQVFTSYWPWSVCDRCGVEGEQTRVGLCYVRSRYLHVRYRLPSAAVAPCGSGAVPRRFGLAGAGGRGGGTVGVRSCRIPCPPGPSPSPQHLALLGFLGYGQSLARGSVPIYYHNHPADTPLVLACPGAQPQHAVAWDEGSRPLYRHRHLEGRHRLYIDTGHHLHLSPALLEDSGTYYCWLQGRRVAEIRLVVYLRLGRQRRLSDPETGQALRAILLCYGGLTGAFVLLLLLKLTLRSLLWPRTHVY